MVSGPSSPQMFVGLGTPNGQGIVDDSADAVPFIQTGNSGGRVSLSEITVQSSQAVTSSGAINGTAIVNPGCRGIMLFLDVSSHNASTGQSPTFDLVVQGQNPANSTYVTLPGASFTQVASTTNQQVLVIHPAIPNDSGTGFRRRPGPLPRSWRLQWDGSALDSAGGVPSTYEFTVGGIYIP